MRRPKRAGLASWARQSRTGRLRLPRWRHAKTEKTRTPWKWVVRLIRTICVLGGTALAGATFWYGYDGYLDSKCMTLMQEWSNLVDLLNYCDQEGNDLATQGIACEKMDRHALPEPPSCVSRGTTSAIVTKPAVSPDFTSESGVPRNGSRAVSTIQDLKPSSKLTVGGWDSSSVAEPAATSTASQLLTTDNHVTPTTLIQSRTVTQTSLLDSPSTPTPTLAIPDLIPPPPTSAYPTPLSEGETITQYPDLETVTMDNGNGQKPLYSQATADLGGTTLIRVALSRILDFQTLLEHPAATMQLFDLVPLLLSLYGSIPPSDIRVHEILPLRSADGGGSITAVAHVYCSADQVANLRHAFWDPVSQLYSLRHEHLATVADMFGELSSLLNLACRPQSATIAALLGTCAPQAIRIQRDEHAVTPGHPFVPAWFKDHLLGGMGADKDVARDFVTRAPAAPNQAFWSIAFVFAPLIVLAYSFAMIFVARRYKAKKRRALASHRLSAGAKSSGFAVRSDIKEGDFLHHPRQMTGIPS